MAIRPVFSNSASVQSDHRFYHEFAGLSTDTKPETDDISTGSLFHEVDTKKVYAYDEDGDDGEKWIEQLTLGG